MEAFFPILTLLLGALVYHILTELREDKQHGQTLEREERARTFEAKREAYGALSNAVHDFSFELIRAGRDVQNVAVPPKETDFLWESAELLKNLRKASAYVRLYAPKGGSVAIILDELDISAKNYSTIYQNLINILWDEKKMPEVARAAREQATMTVEWGGIKDRLLETMQKDLGVK